MCVWVDTWLFQWIFFQILENCVMWIYNSLIKISFIFQVFLQLRQPMPIQLVLLCPFFVDCFWTKDPLNWAKSFHNLHYFFGLSPTVEHIATTGTTSAISHVVWRLYQGVNCFRTKDPTDRAYKFQRSVGFSSVWNPLNSTRVMKFLSAWLMKTISRTYVYLHNYKIIQ